MAVLGDQVFKFPFVCLDFIASIFKGALISRGIDTVKTPSNVFKKEDTILLSIHQRYHQQVLHLEILLHLRLT